MYCMSVLKSTCLHIQIMQLYGSLNCASELSSIYSLHVVTTDTEYWVAIILLNEKQRSSQESFGDIPHLVHFNQQVVLE